MNSAKNRTLVVTGATGLQGGAVVRQLLAEGWQVRALTRNPKSKKARDLAAIGAEIFQGDMADQTSLLPLLEGAFGVFSMQNPILSGIEGEIKQGKTVADAARQAGVQHLVYSSAGTGTKGTGVPSWESKLVIEEHIKSLGLPFTIFRPMAFMELMTEKKFFPAASTWHVMPALMGSHRKVVWLSVIDLAVIVAKAFAEPDRFIGKEFNLLSDVQSIDECREIYREVVGKNPPQFAMPPWIFERFGFIGEDLTNMWRWLREATLDTDTSPTLAIHPEALTVRSWLKARSSMKIKGTP